MRARDKKIIGIKINNQVVEKFFKYYKGNYTKLINDCLCELIINKDILKVIKRTANGTIHPDFMLENLSEEHIYIRQKEEDVYMDTDEDKEDIPVSEDTSDNKTTKIDKEMKNNTNSTKKEKISLDDDENPFK